MSSEESLKIEVSEGDFWQHATRYTSKTQDEPFVNEIAYMMVTLHKTRA